MTISKPSNGRRVLWCIIGALWAVAFAGLASWGALQQRDNARQDVTLAAYGERISTTEANYEWIKMSLERIERNVQRNNP